MAVAEHRRLREIEPHRAECGKKPVVALVVFYWNERERQGDVTHVAISADQKHLHAAVR